MTDAAEPLGDSAGLQSQLAEALQRLSAAAELAPDDQVRELEEVHRLLQDALSTLDGV